MNTDGHRWTERGGKRESQGLGVRSSGTSSLKPSFATDEHRWNWEAGPDEGPDSIGID